MEAYLKVARQAAQAAGARLLELFGKAEVRCKEVSHNLVTQADIESEEIITRLIGQVFPGHRFLREEGESTGQAGDDHLWIIDPLDATNNYAHGIPHFSLSIAYAEKGVVQMGLVLDPLRRELFTAMRGGGAYRNQERLEVSRTPRLDASMVGTGFYYERGLVLQKTLATVAELFSRKIHCIRRMGSAAIDLCWVACGRFDAFYEYRLAPWDYAAGSLIIEEAGGRCTDRVGGPLSLSSWSIITANPLIFDSFLETARWRD